MGERSQPLAGSAAVADANPLGRAVVAMVDGAELAPGGFDVALCGDPALTVGVVSGRVGLGDLPFFVEGAVTAARWEGAHGGMGAGREGCGGRGGV